MSSETRGRSRRLARLVTVVSGVVVPIVVSAGPALAGIKPDDGEQPASSLGIGGVLLLYFVIPIGAFLVIGGLSLLPSALSRPRYRPGRPWDNEAMWFGAPEDGAAAKSGETPATGTSARGGASAEW